MPTSPPRRSTRAVQPLPTKPHHSDSSSSLSSARPERSTRLNGKNSSPQKSTTPQSQLSSEDGADAAQSEHHSTRRSKRAHNADDDEEPAKTQEEELDDEAVEEGDDITRCLCGSQDYPGPPVTKSNPNVDPNDDTGGLFIQCDRCHVWQHGGCVGIMDESQSPDNYYCELCEKDLHDVTKDLRGRRYSFYLPLHPERQKSVRKSSMSKHEDAKARKERAELSRLSVESSALKRRSTMNSRQAYDEEETLRRVIEESKGDTELAASVMSSRKGKRTRDDSSEEIKQEHKRQRTGSESPAPASTHHTASLDAESDDETPGGRPSASSLKKQRSAAAENQRLKEAREREKQRELQRAEAAGRRQQRAGRRRADESEPIDETPNPQAASIPPSSQPPSPPPSAPPAAPSSSHKKGAGKKAKRLGRNQYTRDRDFGKSGSPAAAKNERAILSSGDDDGPGTTTNGNGKVDSGSGSKNSPSSGGAEPVTAPKPRGRWKNRKVDNSNGDGTSAKDDAKGLSIETLNKKAQAMLEYITRMQGEVVERSPLVVGGMGVEGGPVGPVGPVTGEEKEKEVNGEAQSKAFAELSSKEMMEKLTNEIHGWQKTFGEAKVEVA